MANNSEKAVVFEPEEDVDNACSPNRAPIPQIQPAISGGDSSAITVGDSSAKETKGRGFYDKAVEVARIARLSLYFHSIDNEDNEDSLTDFFYFVIYQRDRVAPQHSAEGWVIVVTGLAPPMVEHDLYSMFGRCGKIKNFHLNMDSFYEEMTMGYALIEYGDFEAAQRAIKQLNGSSDLGPPLNVDWAFRNPSRDSGGETLGGGPIGRHRSRSPARRF